MEFISCSLSSVQCVMCHMITRAQNAINRSHERGDEGELRATGKSLFPRLIPPQTGDTWGETGIILHNNIGTRTRHSFINTGHRVYSVECGPTRGKYRHGLCPDPDTPRGHVTCVTSHVSWEHDHCMQSPAAIIATAVLCSEQGF